MPGFDRTGPWGGGPMTGGRRGLCASGSAGVNQFGGGRSFGRGMGFGRGRGFGVGRRSRRCTWVPVGYDAPYSSVSTKSRDQEIDSLRNQARALRDELDDIESRISGLEKKEN